LKIIAFLTTKPAITVLNVLLRDLKIKLSKNIKQQPIQSPAC